MTVTLVIGASASGKSAYAESLCLGHDGPRVYLATMEPFGEEGARRIARHRALREGKGFSTLERTRDVGAAVSGLPRGCTLLLEDVGNLVANELFAEGGLSPRDPDAAARECSEASNGSLRPLRIRWWLPSTCSPMGCATMRGPRHGGARSRA